MMVKDVFKQQRVWMSLLVVLMLIGFGVYIRQLVYGLQVTGMSNPVSWGLYIITFAFLVGLSAGGLIVSSSAYVLKIKKLERMAPMGIVVAVACIVGAAAIILVDVGHPERVLNIVFGGRYTSPIAWDFLVITIYLCLGLFECWIFFSKRWRSESEERREKALGKAAWCSLPIAILVHSITAWIFGLQVGRPYWNTSLMAPIFISSAIVSGLGILLIVAYFGRKNGIPGLEDDNVGTLAKILIGFILLDLFLLFCDFFTLAYAGGTMEADAANLILKGRFAPLLWTEFLVGMIVPLIILAKPSTRRSRGWLALAGFLVMGAVFLKRINIILPSFVLPNIQNAPGISTGRFVQSAGQFFIADKTSFAVMGSYFPTLSEILITVGVLALVAFVITIGVGLVRRTQMQSEATIQNKTISTNTNATIVPGGAAYSQGAEQ